MLREETAAVTPHFDAVDYLLYIRRRWRVIAVACGVAAAMAFFASLLLPKRYTATASILIEAPAGTDPRSFTAISPVYLESLKTYERVALSDSLFQRALEKFKLFEPNGSQSVEGLKRRMLDVNKVRDTKILEIAVTVKNPVEAQAMAQFLAEETVRLSSTATREAGRESMDEGRRQMDEARERLEQARATWEKQSIEEPVDTLREEIDSLVELEQRLRRNIAEANASAAEYEARAKTSGDGAEAARDAGFLMRESTSHQARARQLERDLQKVEETIKGKDRVIAKRSAKQETMASQVKLAQTRLEAATKLYEELQSSVGFAGERLRVIDPGIVPKQPSEPKKALNVIVAVAVAFFGAMAYLTYAYNIQR